METIQLPYPVPYCPQVVSVDLAEAILTETLPAEFDPGWAETGAETPQEYAYWTQRACGVACVKMCVEALGGPPRSLVAWARAGVQMGGYLIGTDENGQQREIGWRHAALAELIESAGAGFHARPLPAALDDFAGLLRQGKMLVASVSYEIGTTGPVTRKGGHLVVVTGVDADAGQVQAVYVNNPSGRHPDLRTGARIPAERFASGYTGRIIAVWKNSD